MASGRRQLQRTLLPWPPTNLKWEQATAEEVEQWQLTNLQCEGAIEEEVCAMATN
jgi:hypothetical protein